MTSSDYSDSARYSQPAGLRQIEQSTPPEPLTEFQKFVASSTGIVLPIFGADLFKRVPSTFAPVDMAPVPPNYVVGPGDELRIRIWGQINTQADLRVDRSGEIYLPQVGNVHIAGLTFSELDTHLRSALGRVYRNFDLTVNMGQIRSIQVYVSGEARRPGVYTVSSLSTLVDALFVSGGPAAEGSMRAIELRRDGAVVTRIDLYDLLIKGDKTKDAALSSGDVIYIPPVGTEAAVLGSVRNPGIYELLPQESLGDLINEARGVTAVAADARVSIERIDEHHDRQTMEVAYDVPGLKIVLAEGDVVRLYSIVPKYAKTVTLRGNLANPGRFAWHQGMRVSELIPDKDSLLTRNYWWHRAQMGMPAPEFEPLPDLASLRQPQDDQANALPSAHSANGSLNQVESEQDPYSEEQAQGAQSTKQTAQNSSLASTQNLLPSRSQGSSEPVVVRVPAPEIDWDYAVIERINQATLKTDLVPFDLGKLVLQRDASQDLVLEPNDVVTIFSEADIPMPVA
ncbi:MAG: polysaccharide biosynthesis/export family protein, partial [Terracidiphilus sp.]